MSSEFMRYTVGLEANTDSMVGMMAKVEFSRLANGRIRLQVVSGRNLANARGTALISASEYDDRPRDDIEEARWALGLCGWTLMADDVEN